MPRLLGKALKKRNQAMIDAREAGMTRDELAAMLKPAWDGFVDAGLLLDDRAEMFTVEPVSFEKGSKRRVVIQIRGS